MGSASVWVALAVLLGGPAMAASTDFTGSRACKACHEAVYASWLGTAHARAGDSLPAAQRTSRRCLACHGTGEAPAGPARTGVGCEACHGAGAAYGADDIMRDRVLAAALGLRTLTTSDARGGLCRRCHGGETTLGPFEPDLAWQRIAH